MGKKNQTGEATILLVESEPWEHDELLQRCEHGCQVISRDHRLEELPDSGLPENVTILSTFIHSRVTPDQLSRLPDLKFIATRSTGFDHINIEECNRRGILVSNVPHYGENTVAEHTFALLLALTRKIHRGYERTIRGDFSIEGLRGIDLYGKTFGTLGVGSIGVRALRIAAGFGMRLLAFDIKPRKEWAKEIGFQYVSFDELLSQSNVLSIHLPYNKQTHHLIDADAIAKLPVGAVIINTARGGIVDPQALIDGLRSGQIGGAGMDVLEAESEISEEAELMSSAYDVETLRSLVRSHALLRHPNVIITPHVAFNSIEAIRRIIDTTLENIHAFLIGKPRNVVNAPIRVVSG